MRPPAAPAPVPQAAPALDTARIAAARLWASSRLPYFAAGLFALRPVSTPGLGTLAVDRRWRLYCDPEVVAAWTVKELGAVLVHELMHVIRDHAGRAEALGIGPTRAYDWNLAADAEINDDLLELKLPLPGTPVTPETLGAEPRRLAEEYLLELRPKARRNAGRAECGSGSHGQVREWEQDGSDGGADQEPGDEGIGEEEAVLLRRRIAVDVMAASRAAGTVPGGLARWAAEVAEPKVDWRRLLAGAVRRSVDQVAGRVDYSLARRSRRASAMAGVVVPGLVRPVPSVAVVVDTSGSMNRVLLARCLAELGAILDSLGGPARLEVLEVDTEVQARRRVGRSRPAGKVELTGGGGTDMGAGLAAAAEARPRPDVVVVLTDGETPWPEQAPAGVRVVVCLVGGPSVVPVPAWARAVVIDEAERS